MKNTEKETFTVLKEVFAQKGKSITIVPHENPDGDAIGSAIGFAEILLNKGHDVQIISPNDYPDFLKWFSSTVEILQFDNNKRKAKNRLKNTDILICVDFNEAKRAGFLENQLLKFEGIRILIDHHPFPTDFCEFTISETQYSSTAELIYDVTRHVGLIKHVNLNAAEALYTGILTDTGSFSHNFSQNTFKIVSEILKFGIDTDKIHSNVYHNFSEKRMNLLGYCLNEKMIVYPEHRAAVITLSKKELEEYDFKPGDTEGFVNLPLSINNIVFSALFIEKEELVKASFRSKGDFPANKVAKEYFNGGGHLNAAGGESNLTLFETFEKFRQLLPVFKHQLLETTI